MNGKRIVVEVFFIVLIFAVCWAAVALLEVQFLRDAVTVESGALNEWLEIFHRNANLGVGLAGLAVLLWYILCQWVFKVNDYRKSNKRPLWLFFFTFPLVGLAFGLLYTPGVLEGKFFPFLFLTINPLVCFYLATTFFTPVSFKYVPVGARAMRFWG